MLRRDLLKSACALGIAAPFLSPWTALAQTAEDPFLASVHPQLRQIAAQILNYTRDAKPLSHASLAELRKGMPGASAKPSIEVPFEKRTIAGGHRQADVIVYVVNPKPGGSRPAILHTHGGGFIAGSAEQSIPDLQKLCRELDCAAVSVEYRLAPETTWRGSVEDNYAGLKWLHANAAQLGVDPTRIAVMGESAGGGHAALLAIAARDRGEVPVCFQCLVYPMLDDRTGSTRTVPPHIGNIIWNSASNRFGWESFLGSKPGGKTSPAGAVPARVVDLAGLPPAWIGVGSIDLFFDEDVDYAQRLNNAGVLAELLVIPGAFHGFDNAMFNTRIGRSFNAAKLDALRNGFGLPVA